MKKIHKKQNNAVKKLLSVFIVFFLVSTALSTTVSSRSTLSEKISNFKEKIDNLKTREKPIINFLQDSNLKEKIENIKEKVQNILDRIKPRNGTSSGPILSSLKNSPRNNLLRSLANYISLKESNSLLSFYTNYAGNEKTTPIRLGMPKSIDVDGDGDKDIRVSYSIYPFVERPLVFTFNVKLNIDRLIGFEDENEYFEAYLQLHFLGLLDANNTNDVVKFGYASEEGYEVPKDFSVTYKYLPYFFYKEKPKHKIHYNPGLMANEDILGLVFGYDNADVENGTYKSQGKWTTYLDPAVKTNLVFGGADDYVGRHFVLETSKETKATITYDRIANGSEFNGGLVIDKLTGFTFDMEVTPFKEGGGRIEYTQNGTDPVNATLFFKKNNSMYIYLEGIPPHIKLSWEPESQGNIQFTTFNQSIKKVGVRDTPPGLPLFTTNAYLENLPSEINFNWNVEFEKGGQLDVFCQQAGVSAHLISNNFLGTGTKVEAHFQTNTNFNFSVFWDTTKKSFGIMRTSSDIQMDLHILGVNGSSFDFSANVKNSIVGPFEIILDQLFDGKAEIEFTSNVLEINNLDARLNLVGTGTFIAKMTYLKFDSSQSGIKFFYSYKKLQDGFTFGYEFDIYNGAEIRGLILGYNDFLLPIPDINVGGSFHQANSVTVTDAKLNYYISEDQSYGYIELGGALSVTTDNVLRNAAGEIVGLLKGTILFTTQHKTLNISWETINNETQLNVEGQGLASISGFELIVGNKINIGIASLVGEFSISTYRKTGNVKIYLDDAFAAMDMDFNIKIENLMNVSLKCNVDLNFKIGASGYVGFAWSSGNISFISGDGNINYQGKLGIYGLKFSYGSSNNPKEMIGISFNANSIELIGGFKVGFDVSYDEKLGLKINFNSKNGIRLEMSGIRVSVPGVPAVTISGVSLYGKGTITFDLEDLLIDFDASARLGITGIIISDKASNLFIRCNSISISVSGKITVDLNQTKVSFDVQGRFGIDNLHMTRPQVFKLTFFVSAQAKASIAYNSTAQKVKIFVDMTKMLKIDGLHMYVTGDLLNGSWIGVDLDKFHVTLRDDAEATIFLNESGLKFYANVKYVEISNLQLRFKNKKKVDETYFRLEGKFDFTFGGGYFWIIVDTTKPSVRMKLHDGDVSITGFKLGVDIGTKSRIDLQFKYLTITADFEFELFTIKDSLHIFAQGTGDIFLSQLYFDANLDLSGVSVAVSIGNFELGLDSVRGSIIDLQFEKDGEEWTFKGIHSASISGSISDLTIQDLYISTDIFIPNPDYPDETLFALKIDDAFINFKGSGNFIVNIYEKQNKILFDMSLSVSSSDGYIDVGNFFMNAMEFAVITIRDLLIQGRTTISMNGEGEFVDNLPFPLFEIRVNADSESWNIGYFDLQAYGINVTRFYGVGGSGQITVGAADIVDTLYGPMIKNFIVGVDGNFKWDKLVILGAEWNNNIFGVQLEGGSFVGNADLYIDFAFLWDFNVNRESLWKINVYESTEINFAKIQGPDGYISIIALKLEPGNLVIKTKFNDPDPTDTDYDLSEGYVTWESSGFQPKVELFRWVRHWKNLNRDTDWVLGGVGMSCIPYVNISWNIDAIDLASRTLNGSFGIDTNNIPIWVKFDLFGFITTTGEITAEDAVFDIDTSSGVGNLHIDTGGQTFTGDVLIADIFRTSGGLLADDFNAEYNLDGDGDGYVNIVNNKFEGEFTYWPLLKWTWTASLSKHFELRWNIDGDGDGYLYVDTDDEYCYFNLTIQDLSIIEGKFKAQDKSWDWDFTGTDIDINPNGGGTITYVPGELAVGVYIKGDWYWLIGNSDGDLRYAPTAIAGGPYDVYPDDTWITLDCSQSHDNDEYDLDANGYSIKSIRWDYDHDTNELIKWDTMWLPFENNKRLSVDLSNLYDGDDDSNNGDNNGDQTDNNNVGSLSGPTPGGPDHQQISVMIYFAKLEVKDNEGQTAVAYAQINVHYDNTGEDGMPVADAGGPYYVSPGDTWVTFDSSGSHDTDEYTMDAGGYKIDKIRWKFPDRPWTLWRDFDNKKTWSRNMAYLLDSDDSGSDDDSDNQDDYDYQNDDYNYNSDNNQYDDRDNNNYYNDNNDYYNEYNNNQYDNDKNNYDSDKDQYNNNNNYDGDNGFFSDDNQYDNNDIGALGNDNPIPSNKKVTIYSISLEVRDNEGKISQGTATLTVYHSSNDDDNNDPVPPDDNPPNYDIDDSIYNYCHQMTTLK